MSAGVAPIGYRSAVSRHRLVAAVVAGFVATHISTVVAMWFHGLGLPDLNFNLFNGILLVPDEPPLVQFIVGGIAHYATGMCWALAFVFLIHPLLPWANTTLGNMAKALVWGVVLAFLSALWWVPALFPAFNAGFFSTNLGWNTVFAIFLFHIIYAVNLGAFYNPLPDADAADAG